MLLDNRVKKFAFDSSIHKKRETKQEMKTNALKVKYDREI